MGSQQIDLLIADAKAQRLKPIYCVYASEDQRDLWKKKTAYSGWEDFESGCLLVSAHKVKSKMPTALSHIEADCIPWHYLVQRKHYETSSIVGPFGDDEMVQFLRVNDGFEQQRARGHVEELTNTFPTLDDLNSEQPLDMDIEGIVDFGSPDYERRLSDEAYRERGVARLLEIDVRNFARLPRPPDGIPPSA